MYPWVIHCSFPFFLLRWLRGALTISTFTDKLKEVEESTGYHKVFFFVGLILAIMGVISFIGGAKLLVDLLGFVYPAYMSFKSMDSGSKDDTQWLTYWVVFSFISIAEGVCAWFIGLIPFYYYLKSGAVVWMYHPSMRGAETIYSQALRPLLLPYLEADKSTMKKAE